VEASQDRAIGQTLDYFRLEVGHYPTQEGLQTLITAGTYSN
jgi:Type II secretion system (T2SS), protein G